MSPRRTRLGILLVLGVLLGLGPAASQTPLDPPSTGLDPCESVLALAEQRYVEGDFDSVEALVLDCVYRPEATAASLQRGYRMLALVFLRQDDLVEAQLTVVKLLGTDYTYAPDAAHDPPAYVALVESVKDQLRVESAPVATGEPAPAVQPITPRPLAEPASPAERGLVSLNTGTAAELETVPGIGPILAARIVAHREENGPFGHVEDLIQVSGIGPRTLERLTPHLTVETGPLIIRAGGGVPAAEAAPPASSPVSDRLINLNTASAAELEALHGIGPALAARIVAYREENGPFRRTEDVQAVSGIGPKKFAGFADQVTVE